MIMIKNNELYIGEHTANELANKFYTPLYVYDEETIRTKFRELKNSIAYGNVRIHYACKANSNLSIMKILREEGACIDAVSIGEILASLKVGFKQNQILFTGSNVTNEEMKFVIRNKIMINIDSLSQLKRYGQLNPNSKISIRVNTGVGAGHHGHVVTGGYDSKFGVYVDEINKAKKSAKKYNLQIVGIHQHIGSGILEVKQLIRGVKALLKIAKNFKDLEFVDIGGGIGVPYRPNEQPFDIKQFGKELSELFETFCSKYGKNLVLLLEPGRYLVAESGVLLCRVNTIKKNRKYKFVGVDTGFNHLIRPMAYGSYHYIVPTKNVSSKTKEKVLVCGNICESGDIFTQNKDGIEERFLPEVKENDILAISTVGAYGYSMSSNYNLRPKPAEILVNGNEIKMIRKAETFNDLV